MPSALVSPGGPRGSPPHRPGGTASVPSAPVSPGGHGGPPSNFSIEELGVSPHSFPHGRPPATEASGAFSTEGGARTSGYHLSHGLHGQTQTFACPSGHPRPSACLLGRRDALDGGSLRPDARPCSSFLRTRLLAPNIARRVDSFLEIPLSGDVAHAGSRACLAAGLVGYPIAGSPKLCRKVGLCPPQSRSRRFDAHVRGLALSG